MPRYLTVDEVAAVVRVDPITVRRWIQQRILPAHRLGPRCVRISQDELEQWLKSR